MLLYRYASICILKVLLIEGQVLYVHVPLSKHDHGAVEDSVESRYTDAEMAEVMRDLCLLVGAEAARRKSKLVDDWQKL